MSIPLTPGQVCYEAYRAEAGGISLVSGQPLPEWDAQDLRIQAAWEAGAAAVQDMQVSTWGADTEYR